MDLRETEQTTTNRHPWELARSKALREIILSYRTLGAGDRVLDLGCGDGFLIDALCPPSVAEIDALDIHLTDEQMVSFAAVRPRVRFSNTTLPLVDKGYQLITLFDVLEHVEDDAAFLKEMVSRFASRDALIFCTVPAFNSLYSAHDSFLKHYRRYHLSGLSQLLERSGLRVGHAGYLFASLLPIRAMSVVMEKVFGVAEQAPGIGHWCHGPLLTSLMTELLNFDNSLLRWLGRRGIPLPGLTVWALCTIRR